MYNFLFPTPSSTSHWEKLIHPKSSCPKRNSKWGTEYDGNKQRDANHHANRQLFFKFTTEMLSAIGLLRDPPVKGPNVIPEVAAARLGNGGGQPERPFLLYSNFTRVFKKDCGNLVLDPFPTSPPSLHVDPSPSPFSPPGPFSPGSGLALGRRLP